MKNHVRILMEIVLGSSGILGVKLLKIKQPTYKRNNREKETNKKKKERKFMCRVLNRLDGVRAEDLVNDFRLYTSLPINLNGILNHYDISVFPSDFEAMSQFENIREEVSTKGEILGAVTVDEDDVKIFYRKDDNKHRQKFTIAHELAHCCLNASELTEKGHIEFRTDIESSSDEKEMQANIFAGELLIPKKLIDLIYDKVETVDLKYISEIFDVSQNVMRARLDYLKRPYCCN